ncbi:unnamed protein product [Tetraodon nigroviridis]|uniref:(spotted green pufferfish) hypothetical protein n=1 Tax=Tetraodon nigroviridis TaxID=99883 RepID=Q4SQS4_TETNG|nr:unnamed protein product [Tetraodon nigroviridis]
MLQTILPSKEHSGERERGCGQGGVFFTFVVNGSPVAVLRVQHQLTFAASVASCHAEVPPILVADLHLPVGPPRGQTVDSQDASEPVEPLWIILRFPVFFPSIDHLFPLFGENEAWVCGGWIQLYVNC